MSRFFRTNSDSSSDSSEASYPDENVDDKVVKQSTDRDASLSAQSGSNVTDEALARLTALALPTAAAQRPARLVDEKNDGSQLLLHALLEERCVREVVDDLLAQGLPKHRHDQVYIKQQAQQRYRTLCTTLVSHNLVSAGLDNARFDATRQYFRDGLDTLLRDTSTVAGANALIKPTMRRLLTDIPAHPPHQSLLTFPTSLGRLESPSPFSLLSFAPTRYAREFEQVSTLGRGGFGVVYHVQHRIDGIQYAVKKIPVNQARLARMQARGQDEIVELTREVRTLARLEHPNIVRYYAAWVEWTNTFLGSNSDSSEPQLGDSRRDVRDVSSEVIHTDGSTSISRVVTQSNSDNNEVDVIFENSTSLRAGYSAPDVALMPASPSFSQASSTSASTSDGPLLHRSGPTLCLHLQMGLYPLTLADFISPPPCSDRSVQPLAHCFHISPTLAILTAVVAGVEYLHSESILHRDLKPANIFMSATQPRRGSHQSSRTVDLFRCATCTKQGVTNPVSLHVRIGDFGLVTELSKPGSDPDSSLPDGSPEHVGTAIYRPLVSMPNSPQLDIFALGVIMFELLWRFGTRMERQDCIQRLKLGTFPKKFSEIIGDEDGRLEECIRKMLSGQMELGELRRELRELQLIND